MTVPAVSGKLRKVKNRSSTAPISAVGRSGRSFIVFLGKDADDHCAMPAPAGHASVERILRHRKPAGSILPIIPHIAGLCCVAGPRGLLTPCELSFTVR